MASYANTQTGKKYPDDTKEYGDTDMDNAKKKQKRAQDSLDKSMKPRTTFGSKGRASVSAKPSPGRPIPGDMRKQDIPSTDRVTGEQVPSQGTTRSPQAFQKQQSTGGSPAGLPGKQAPMTPSQRQAAYSRYMKRM